MYLHEVALLRDLLADMGVIVMNYDIITMRGKMIICIDDERIVVIYLVYAARKPLIK